ncbi:MAG TPA: hypothetical protein VIU62_06055 [Chloroflexota bacterium]
MMRDTRSITERDGPVEQGPREPDTLASWLQSCTAAELCRRHACDEKAALLLTASETTAPGEQGNSWHRLCIDCTCRHR